MLRSEHLDVRTVTMGISLFDCAAPDFDTFAYKVRSKILRNAEKLVETCDIVGDRYGIPVVNKRISVSPMATVCAGFTRDQMVEACRVLDDCAKDVGVDFIGGFGALVAQCQIHERLPEYEAGSWCFLKLPHVRELHFQSFPSSQYLKDAYVPSLPVLPPVFQPLLQMQGDPGWLPASVLFPEVQDQAPLP